MVTAEAGGGKTTLVKTFVDAASGREPLAAGVGRCLEHRGPGEPYMPVLEALGGLADGDSAERVVEALAQRAPTWLAELPWLLDADDLAALRERIGGATKERMLREIVEALESLSSDRSAGPGARGPALGRRLDARAARGAGPPLAPRAASGRRDL